MLAIIRSMFVVAIAVAAVSAGTYSYFSTSETSSGNTITTGELNIDLLNQNTTDTFSFAITDMFPGDEKFVNFDVLNDSPQVINLRGFATGEWNNVSLTDDDLIQVTKAEYWDGDSWEAFASAAEGLTGEFYYSPNGLNSALFDVAPNAKAQFRLTVKLDELAGNDYQGEVYTAGVSVEGKQDISGLDWPPAAGF